MKKRRVLTNLVGQWLWRIAKPYAPRRAPVAPWIRLIHYWALRLSEPNPAKGKPPTLIRPGYYYDADLAQRLVDTGVIKTKPLTVNAPKYAFQQWTVTYQGGLLSQGDGSQADLIWVLTMPAERARKPVLFLEDPLLGAPKILDGSHRLIRSVVDGLSDIEVQVIEPADVQHILGRAQQA
ncbi:MAG: hypothetical protein EPO51_20755 [Phenylobacterium sp.]|uniref:hypothetical protein n=1 Tax=Phenylobacterium sp. TaxID=1871053 RepID=UPI001209C49D|nr:hypothetical protein [Phenylobacterium sp.]TAJ69954.1 MAG: hypothetical protein EPO51_20755 [Phenylobacterium sp.]